MDVPTGPKPGSEAARNLNHFQSIRARILEEIGVEKKRTWGSENGGALIEGLPDDIVENHVWPLVRKTIEDQEDRPTVLLGNIQDTLSLSSASKKWRYLVTTSKVWAVFRFLQENHSDVRDPFGPVVTIPRYFRVGLAMCPPIDVLARFPLFDLVNFINEWVNCLEFYEKVPYDDYVNDDFTGRVTRWQYGHRAGDDKLWLSIRRLPNI